MTDNSASQTPGQSRQPPRERKKFFSAAIALGVAVLGAIYIVTPKSKETTEDAYIKADLTQVASKVRGHVVEVLVADNQVVERGDVLVRIDGEEFDARLAQASSELGNAQATASAARAALEALDVEEKLAASNVVAVQSSIRSADAQLSRANADDRRYERLRSTGAVTEKDADQFRANSITAAAEAERSRAALVVSQNQALVVKAKRASLKANLAQAEAAVARSKAALDLARQDSEHTVIKATVAGVVANRQAQVGDYVQQGSRLLTIVPPQTLHVVAHFKETQIQRMKVGQKVDIHVDAMPNEKLTGTVDSLAPGSGAEFAMLPFEPGTGNFTKIVQRVGVRIRLDTQSLNNSHLRAGLSSTVSVHVDS